MRKADLKVGALVVIKTGKYDSSKVGVVIDLDPGSLVSAYRAAGIYRRGVAPQGKVVVSYLSAGFIGQKYLETYELATSKDAQWLTPILVALGHIRDFFTAEYVQDRLHQDARWKTEWETDVAHKRAERDRLKKQVDAANRALGDIYFTVYAYGLEDYRVYAPHVGHPPYARVTLDGAKDLESVVRRLALINQNIEEVIHAQSS